MQIRNELRICGIGKLPCISDYVWLLRNMSHCSLLRAVRPTNPNGYRWSFFSDASSCDTLLFLNSCGCYSPTLSAAPSLRPLVLSGSLIRCEMVQCTNFPKGTVFHFLSLIAALMIRLSISSQTGFLAVLRILSHVCSLWAFIPLSYSKLVHCFLPNVFTFGVPLPYHQGPTGPILLPGPIKRLGWLCSWTPTWTAFSCSLELLPTALLDPGSGLKSVLMWTINKSPIVPPEVWLLIHYRGNANLQRASYPQQLKFIPDACLCLVTSKLITIYKNTHTHTSTEEQSTYLKTQTRTKCRV
jgi:hypothetical protein